MTPSSPKPNTPVVNALLFVVCALAEVMPETARAEARRTCFATLNQPDVLETLAMRGGENEAQLRRFVAYVFDTLLPSTPEAGVAAAAPGAVRG